MRIFDSIRHNHWSWPLALLTITLVALTSRWYYVATAMVENPVRGDAIQYFAYAWNLVHHGAFAKDLPDALSITPDNYRDPGYPLFLAVWMKLLGSGDTWYAYVLLFQALLGALTVTMTAQLGKNWLPARWAVAAGLLMAVWPHSITINGYLLSETLFGFLCALGLLTWVFGSKRQSAGWAIAAGGIFGMAALTNAMLLPFGLLLAGFMAWRKFASFKICTALAVGSLLLPGIWAIRNTNIASPVAGSSSMDRALMNLEQGSRPDFQTNWRNSVLGDANTQAKAQVALHAVDEEYGELQDSRARGLRSILQRFAEHPLQYGTWYLFSKPRLLWGWDIQIGQGDIYVYPMMNSPFQTKSAWIAWTAVCHAFNTLLMLLALASLFFAWHSNLWSAAFNEPNNRIALIPVICLLGFVTLVYTTLQAEPRYSIPFRSFEILLAMTTLCGIAAWLRARKTNSVEATT